MFTGIINCTGRIAKIKKNKKGAHIIFAAPTRLRKKLKMGSSLSCNGVCLTVVKLRVTRYALRVTTFLMNETLRLTSFAQARVGDSINLEPSLRLGDEIGGHFVFGHVDGVGKILELKKDGDSLIMKVQMPRHLMKYFVKKGSVSLEGISLTIIGVGKNFIKVSLIPHTMAVTNLKHKKVGDGLNVEVDMLARYHCKVS